MLVVMTGVPGIGKSTTIKKAFEKLGSESERYNVTNYGDVMLKTAKQDGLVEHRDEMRQLTLEEQHRIQKEAAMSIRNMADQEDVILDTHSTIKTPKGYIPGMPKWVLEELKPDCIVLLEANPEDIEVWRNKDLTGDFRRRETGNLEATREHQTVNKSISMAYSMMTGTPIKIIQKNEGQLEEAAGKLIEVLKE